MDGTGPYITTGELREHIEIRSDTKSEFETVKVFNLDKLNEDHPEWLRRDARDGGQILESPDSFAHSLVHRLNRERLRFEFGNSSTRSRLRRPQDVSQT